MYGFYYDGPSMHGVPTDDEEYERLLRLETFENELATCCQGRNINCGHHWGRA